MGIFDRFFGKKSKGDQPGGGVETGGEVSQEIVRAKVREPLQSRPASRDSDRALNRPTAPGAIERWEEQKERYQKQGEEVRVAAEAAAQPKRVCILLDATASMSHLIDAAKGHVRSIMDTAWQGGDQVEIMLVVYRDYDCRSVVVEYSPCTNVSETLTTWLGGVSTTGGGANMGEAVEMGLQTAFASGPWDVCFIAGDEPAHSAESLKQLREQYYLPPPTTTAVELARQDKSERRVPIYTLVVPGHPDQAETEKSFAAISEVSGGVTGKLDGSEAMRHMISMALLITRKSPAQAKVDLARYRQKFANELTTGSQAFAQKLLTSINKQ